VVPGPRDEGAVVCQSFITKVQELKDKGKIDLVEPLLIECIDRKEPLKPDPYEPIASRARFEKLVEAEQPHIIHFIGHGERGGPEGQPAFVGLDRNAHWVTGKDFAGLASKSKQLGLVFLQACESALPDPHSPISSVASELLGKGIPAVVAMQAKVENEAANMFARKFYEAIGERKPVDVAVMEGRKAIQSMLKDRRGAF
jgi:hypothetical protein